MSAPTFSIALVRETFFDDPGGERLTARLVEARAAGAELALLPEIPLNPWSPATREARDDDAEPPGGPRAQRMEAAARTAGVALVGGAIVRDPETGVRRNTALVFDAAGELRATYSKLHVPEEPGFWETSHYDPGTSIPAPIDGISWPFAVQICSDSNRPQLSHAVAASGACVLLNARSTESATWERWRTVFTATALTTGCYVLSAARPDPEFGVEIGGPCFAVAPNGEVLAETEDRLTVVTLEREVLERARVAYPGYLHVRADLYAEAWRRAETGGA
jgi:predicted amidohydrolase